jgi:hypothetical protein
MEKPQQTSFVAWALLLSFKVEFLWNESKSLVNGWQSVQVFKYLHGQPKPLMTPLASTMLASAS